MQGYGDVPGGVFTYVPRQSLGQPGAGASASYIKTLPDDGSPLTPIENNTSYLGVYYNTGPDLGEVMGVAAADRLRMDERDGRVEVPVPTRKPQMMGPAPSLTLPALSERSRGAWTAARREFGAARPGRSGGSPGVTNPPVSPPPPTAEPPRIKPVTSPGDTLKSAPPDSTKKRPKHPFAKPKPAKPPSEGNG